MENLLHKSTLALLSDYIIEEVALVEKNRLEYHENVGHEEGKFSFVLSKLKKRKSALKFTLNIARKHFILDETMSLITYKDSNEVFVEYLDGVLGELEREGIVVLRNEEGNTEFQVEKKSACIRYRYYALKDLKNLLEDENRVGL